MVAPFLPEKEKVAAIRDELPATGAGIYLDTATAGPLPAAAARAMQEWADWELRVGRAGDVADDEFAERAAEARATLAAVLVTSAERVTIAPGAGPGLLDALSTSTVGSGDRIVIAGTLDPSIERAIRVAGRLGGADVASVRDDGVGEPSASLPQRVEDAVGGRAAAVCVAHVSPAHGGIAPLGDLAAIARRAGAWLVVDGSLAVGAMAVAPESLGADVYIAAGDRWLCGPSGVAVVHRAADAAAIREDGRVATGDGVETRDIHRAAVVGLGRSAGWLAMQVGLDWAYVRTRLLTTRASHALAAIPGVTIRGGQGDVAGTLVFEIAGWPAVEARDQLRRRAFALVGLAPGDALRVGIGCWNTDEEIDRFVDAVAELAAATPGSLPPRPPILVVPGDQG
jgi:L-cysteine/cystine lyase